MAEHNIKQEVQLLTKKEVAKIFRCSTKTIETRVKLGLLKVHEFGPSKLFRSDELPIFNKRS